MTANGKGGAKKTASPRSPKSAETTAEKRERLAAERRAKLAAQMPKFSLAGFKGAPAEESAPEAPQEVPSNLEAPKAELDGGASDFFAGFTVEPEAVSSPKEAPATELAASLQQAEPNVVDADGLDARLESATGSAPSSQVAEHPAEASQTDEALRAGRRTETVSGVPEQQSNRTIPGEASVAASRSEIEDPSVGRERTSSPTHTETLRQPAQSLGSEVAHRSDVSRSGYSVSVASQAGPGLRRPRRPRVERFDPNQRQTSREEAFRELQASAPRYSALLVAYRVGQLSTVPHENRNVHLYGAAFEQLANQGTSDKALFSRLTGQRHKLTPAHYVDAVLDAALAPLDPMCVDEDLIEEEKDHVEELAGMAFAYRSYILNNEYLAGMAKQRFTCPLRREVNAKVSRMMDLLSSMPTIKIQPFEIISAVVADYLNGLPDERPHVESFFEKSTVTTYQ
ncbi:hypothetical protein OG458_42105 (plasmid) [Streptomyces sp. NBC_01281]|uniref:hypothetical protein n=1 Tax=Streptomyces sp. NBC_01281 TaxID=2903811 RepID=UPI002E12279A|nr:hypothetical protein OG458_42105 [Streptomyces sp. NBC_01281]